LFSPSRGTLTDLSGGRSIQYREKLDENGNPILDGSGLSVEEPYYKYLEMNWTTAADCGEWTLTKYRSVLIAVKLMARRKRAAVWLGDVADAIDGGEFATPVQKAASILSCGTDGGSMEVKANLNHEAYDPFRIDFDTGYKTDKEIVIKVVSNVEWKKAQGA
jgi:hypothetical protein